jgi:NitT/TauT family transport system substrate-binding protein
VLVFKKDYIKANPAVVRALIQGYLDGLDYMTKNPDEAAKYMAKFMGISAEEVKEQLSGVYNTTAADFPKVFAKSKETVSFFTSGGVIAGILKAKGQIATVPKIEDTFDDSLAKAVLKKDLVKN